MEIRSALTALTYPAQTKFLPLPTVEPTATQAATITMKSTKRITAFFSPGATTISTNVSFRSKSQARRTNTIQPTYPCGSRTTDTVPLLHAIPPYIPHIATAHHCPIHIPSLVHSTLHSSSTYPSQSVLSPLSTFTRLRTSAATRPARGTTMTPARCSTPAIAEAVPCNFCTYRQDSHPFDAGIQKSTHGLLVPPDKNAAIAAPNYIEPLEQLYNSADIPRHHVHSGIHNSRSYPSDGRLDGD
jgi:hypothetical protein